MPSLCMTALRLARRVTKNNRSSRCCDRSTWTKQPPAAPLH